MTDLLVSRLGRAIGQEASLGPRIQPMAGLGTSDRGSHNTGGRSVA